MSTFVGFVLPDEVRFDAEKYVKDLKEDWNLDYDFAKLYDENDDFPIENIVYIGLYGDENNTVSGYTYGIEQFGKKELEIIKSSEEAEEVYNFLASISDYIITSDVVLNDGETIGFSEEQKIQISVSKGIALDGETIKLGF